MTYICLKSAYNNKYLRFRHEEVQTYSLLQFSGDNEVDPYAQFEVVNSSNSGDLFHLKCVYNNNYLVRWSPNHYWISAAADKPDENQSSWTCTLFKRIDINDGSNSKKIRLLHVQLGHYACLWRIGAPFDSCLFAGTSDIDHDSCDVLIPENLDLLFQLPKRVAFKGENGKYLGIFVSDGLPYLQFSYDSPHDPRVQHELITGPEGIVCIRSCHIGKFWRAADGDWILADANNPRGTNNTSCTFRPALIGINVIALLNMDKTWYCKRFTNTGFESCLNVALKMLMGMTNVTRNEIRYDTRNENGNEKR